MEIRTIFYWSSIKSREQAGDSTWYLVWGDLVCQSPFKKASWDSQFFAGQEIEEGKANLHKYFLSLFPFITSLPQLELIQFLGQILDKTHCVSRKICIKPMPKLYISVFFDTNWSRLSWPNRLTNKKKLKHLSTCGFAVHRGLKPDDFHVCFLRVFSAEMV